MLSLAIIKERWSGYAAIYISVEEQVAPVPVFLGVCLRLSFVL